MSLPTSRNTTYAPGSQVKSADLNDVQDKIIAHETTVVAHGTTLGSHTTSIGSHTTTIASHTSSIGTLNTNVAALLGDMADLPTAIKLKSGTAAPTSGTWALGDVYLNSSPVPGEPAGWVCVTAGTPGVWREWGAVEVPTSSVIKSSNYTATSQDRVLVARGGGGSLTFTLPSSPRDGQYIRIGNHNSSFSLSIDGNGKTIYAQSTTLSAGTSIGLYYVSGTGWFAVG